MNIYCLSGLGADQSVFDPLALDGNMIPIQWIPSFKWESMSAYALRLTAQIDQSKPFVLVGVSFGGMLAIEMNRLIQPQHTFLISSVATNRELPLWSQLFAKLTLHRWIPSFFFQSNPYLLTWLFGVKEPQHKQLIHAITRKSECGFTHLSIDKILSWRNDTIPQNLTRIHGAKDFLLPPVKNIQSKIIEGSGHFAVVEHAPQISEMVNTVLKNLK